MRFICLLLLIVSSNSALLAQRLSQLEAQSQTFDSTRDAAADIHKAIAEARQTGKRIILDIGGDWCPYCRELDQVFQDHPDLLELRTANFNIVRIYYGPDKKNEQALSGYSRILGIPHIFILDSDGTLLHSQHVLDLKTEGTYSPAKIKEFLVRWSKDNK